MRQLLLIPQIVCLLFFGNVKSQCPPGDITFETQAEINAFATNYPNCTEIAGDLTIGNTTVYAITSLSPLSNLTSVQGQLKISNNWSLSSLAGLENINTVGSLTIAYHLSDQLTSLSGLDGLTTVNGSITIGYNDGLISLAGLDNLQTVNGYVWMIQLSALTTISAFNNLTSIGGFLQIYNANNLISLSAFQNLGNINGGLDIGETGLSSVPELSNLQSINGPLRIQNNDNLSDISSLENIDPTTIQELQILNSPLLTYCNLTNICTYLGYDSTSYPRTISGNSGDCLDETAVINACSSLNVNNQDFNSSLTVYRQDDILHVNSDGFEISKIEVYNILGRKIYSNSVNGDHLLISNMDKNQLLIIKIYSSEGKLSIKKIVN